jgi:hypothetical protein
VFLSYAALCAELGQLIANLVIDSKHAENNPSLKVFYAVSGENYKITHPPENLR